MVKQVPEIIRSGNHAAINNGKMSKQLKKPSLNILTGFDQVYDRSNKKNLGASYIPPHYVALMHTDVIIKDQGERIKKARRQ